MASTLHRRLILFAAIGTVVAFAALGRPGTTAAGDFISGSCSTSTLIAFIEAANDESLNPGGDTIHLKPGCTYLPSDPYGTTEFAFPRIDTDVTIDGNGARIELAATATARALFDVGSDGALLLSDLTLAEGSGGQSQGANVNNAGSATLMQVTMTHSVPFGQGGPGILNGKFGVLAIIDSTIEHQSNRLSRGSAIINDGNLTITRSTIHRNTGTTALTSTGTTAIYGSTFSDNTNDGPTAGAIRNQGFLEIHGSSFLANATEHFGGAIYNDGGTADLTIDGSYFEGNNTTIEGGAVYNAREALATVVNSTFVGNYAASPFFPCCVGGTGGALANHHGMRIENVTFSRNGAASGASLASPEGLASVEASVFGPARDGADCSGTITDFGHNLLSRLASGCPSTFAVGDPKLGSPAVNGSGTKTLALGADSAAVDIVPTAGCPSYDQRGVSRPSGPACDAGAFEDQRPTVPGTPGLTSGTNPNTGVFTLGWSASSDPDGTGVTYRLYRRDADDAGYSAVVTTTATSYSFATEPEGTVRYVVAADDGNQASAQSPASGPIVVDRTGPSAPAGAPDRAPDSGGWYRDSVTVTFSGSVDPVLPDGSAGTGVASTTAPQARSTSGTHLVTGTSADAVGNLSLETAVTVKVDADAPLVSFSSCAADVILKSATVAAWSASDGSSGLTGATSGNIPLDTATIGTRSVQITATDVVGHQSTATCAYRVVFDFKGFLSSIVNPPAILDWKAGKDLSVEFTLGDEEGLAVVAVGYPQSAPVSCSTPGDLTSGAPTNSKKGLEFARGQGGRYQYVWETDKSWGGTCRQLIVKLVDGTFHRATIRFK